MPVVEICVEGVTSAIAADYGGANRVELCENRAIGGITPSAGAIVIACGSLAIPVHVLIRPRGGDFVYNRNEFEVMSSDIIFAKTWAHGVVTGMLTRKGTINRKYMAELIEDARPMSVTFHKAFDEIHDPFKALDDLIELGVDRVLTSGAASTAREGVSLLGQLVEYAGKRIKIVAGGSIVEEDIGPLVRAGIEEIHVGSAVVADNKTSTDLVRRLLTAARAAVTIYHITTRGNWEQAVALGHYSPPSLTSEGFIHASTIREVAGTADRFYRDTPELVVLKINLEAVQPAIDWARSPHSSLPFPHIHGPLNLDAVLELIPLREDDKGSFDHFGH